MTEVSKSWRIVMLHRDLFNYQSSFSELISKRLVKENYQGGNQIE